MNELYISLYLSLQLMTLVVTWTIRHFIQLVMLAPPLVNKSLMLHLWIFLPVRMLSLCLHS